MEKDFNLLRRNILEYIESLHLQAGDQLPTEGKICNKFGITRYNARKVVKQLAKQQNWVTVQGAGTFIPEEGSSVPKGIEKVIAVVIPAELESLSSLLLKLTEKVLQKKYNLVFFHISHDDTIFEKECLIHLLKRRVFAVIIDPHPVHAEFFDYIDRLSANGTKCILLNAPKELENKYIVAKFNHRKAGYMAVVQMMRHNVKKIIHLKRYNSVAWQHEDFSEGVQEAVRDFSLKLETYFCNVNFNMKDISWQWQPKDFQEPLEDNCGYLNDNSPLSASVFYKSLKDKKFNNSHMIFISPFEQDMLFDQIAFDTEARLENIIDHLMNHEIELVKSYDPRLIER